MITVKIVHIDSSYKKKTIGKKYLECLTVVIIKVPDDITLALDESILSILEKHGYKIFYDSFTTFKKKISNKRIEDMVKDILQVLQKEEGIEVSARIVMSSNKCNLIGKLSDIYQGVVIHKSLADFLNNEKGNIIILDSSHGNIEGILSFLSSSYSVSRIRGIIVERRYESMVPLGMVADILSSYITDRCLKFHGKNLIPSMDFQVNSKKVDIKLCKLSIEDILRHMIFISVYEIKEYEKIFFSLREDIKKDQFVGKDITTECSNLDDCLNKYANILQPILDAYNRIAKLSNCLKPPKFAELWNVFKNVESEFLEMQGEVSVEEGMIRLGKKGLLRLFKVPLDKKRKDENIIMAKNRENYAELLRIIND